MEANLLEAVNVLVNRQFLVLFIEEFSIFQSRNQDPFIPLDDILKVFLIPVADSNEVWQQLALVVTQVEEALVILH